MQRQDKITRQNIVCMCVTSGKAAGSAFILSFNKIYQNQNHVYWPSTFSHTRNISWVWLLSMYLNKYAV